MVAIIGDGVIGLSTARAVARAGIPCTLIGLESVGMASGAAAGLLAPSIGTLEPSVAQFYRDSLLRYDAFLEPLQAFDPGLRLIRGLIEVYGPDDDPRETATDSGWLREVQASLHAPHGAVMHPNDAAIDNVRLLAALRRAVSSEPRITYSSHDPAAALVLDRAQPAVRLASGVVVEADTIVLAAGAWSAELSGLPRPLPILPLKGQMLAVASSALEWPVMGNDVYLVPRSGEIAIGATVEHAGFDTTTHAPAIEGLRRSATLLCPALQDAPVLRAWAGIRPATPDMRPILGPDPDCASLLYACGHSKNGILLAPMTADSVAALVSGAPPQHDLEPFSIRRFA